MWQQHYTTISDSIGLSALVAAAPIFVLVYLLGIKRKPAWIAAIAGLVTAIVVALGAYQMPAGTMLSSIAFGAVFGLFPIGWIVYWAIVLYRITVDTGNFEIIKDSVGGLTDDRRLQALLIAFALGAFIEGAAGFGTPVAVAAAMLTGLGFSPFYAAGICLIANTAPVAFGSIGIPIATLAKVTGYDPMVLSAWVGRICAPVSLFIPAYLVMVMGGWRALSGVLPAAVSCGIAFAGTQFFVSNYIGPETTDILSALAAIGTLILLFKGWRPTDKFELEGTSVAGRPQHHGFSRTLLAWSPYLFLVVFVLLWGFPPVKALLNKLTIVIPWPGLHELVVQSSPVVPRETKFKALYDLNWLSAAGTACLLASLCAKFALKIPFSKYAGILVACGRQLKFSLLTIACVLGLAQLMNYSGATATMGLAFAATGTLFPFFSSLLGWLAVFLTGSDTSANALFGNLQVITAKQLHLNPELMASANSAGGVMGKMISLQSIAVAAAATGMKSEDEAKLFRFTIRHSIFLASVLGLITLIYSTFSK